MKNAALRGKSDAGNPHVRLDEGDGKVVKFDFHPNAFCVVRLGKGK